MSFGKKLARKMKQLYIQVAQLTWPPYFPFTTNSIRDFRRKLSPERPFAIKENL